MWKARSWLKKWWTLPQRIRTFAEIPIDAAILDTGAAPGYQQIAPKAVQLQQLGLSNSAIAKRLGVPNKTVAKATAWLRRVGHWHGGQEEVLQLILCVEKLNEGRSLPSTRFLQEQTTVDSVE